MASNAPLRMRIPSGRLIANEWAIESPTTTMRRGSTGAVTGGAGTVVVAAAVASAPAVVAIVVSLDATLDSATAEASAAGATVSVDAAAASTEEGATGRTNTASAPPAAGSTWSTREKKTVSGASNAITVIAPEVVMTCQCPDGPRLRAANQRPSAPRRMGVSTSRYDSSDATTVMPIATPKRDHEPVYASHATDTGQLHR